MRNCKLGQLNRIQRVSGWLTPIPQLQLQAATAAAVSVAAEVLVRVDSMIASVPSAAARAAKGTRLATSGGLFDIPFCSARCPS